MYNTHTLNNGLRLIHLPTDSEVVYCGYAVNAGARHEQKGEEGLAHFCEHMTFKGTENLTPMKIINTLELVGGDLNAFTTKEDTFYYAGVLRQHFNRAVDLLTEIVFHSTYPQQEIDREMEVVCDEIESYRDSPAELIYDEFENEIFAGYPLGHNVLGEKETVRNFKTEDCRRFTSRLYRPDNAVFYVVGNIDFSRLVRRMEAYGLVYAGRDMLDVTPSQPLPLAVGGKRKDTDDMQTHQSHVMLGTAITSDIEKWRIPMFITNNILGGPCMNSRLNISLREKRGLVYTVESIMTGYTDALLWSVYFGCDSSDVSRCLRLVHNQLQKLQKAPMTASALNAAKRQLKGQIALASENRENYGLDMAKLYLHKGTLKSNERLFAAIDKIVPQDIFALCNTHLSDDNVFTLTFS